MKIIDEGYLFNAENAEGDRRVCTFTSLCRLRSGTVLASFRRGSAKDSADGDCCVVQSTDGGDTWEMISPDFKCSADGVPGEIREADLTELPDATVTAFLTWIDRRSGGALYDSETDRVLPSRLLAARSTDGGRTWESCETLDTGSLTGPVMTGPVARSTDDRWLAFFENFEPKEEGGVSLHGAHALYSQDGRSFRVVDVARHPQDELVYWDQRHAVCPRTGRVAAMFWTYDRKREKNAPIHVAWGDFDKLAWETPRSTGIEGQIAFPVPLPDGRLLAFYVHRSAPGSMRLIASEDGGETWDHDGETIVYDDVSANEQRIREDPNYAQIWEDTSRWTFGHPTAVLLDERTVLLAYYAGPQDDCLNARWARVAV